MQSFPVRQRGILWHRIAASLFLPLDVGASRWRITEETYHMALGKAAARRGGKKGGVLRCPRRLTTASWLRTVPRMAVSRGGRASMARSRTSIVTL
jgi:hypothetical protein